MENILGNILESINQRELRGVYYTNLGNPFELKPFQDWAKKINLKNLEVLEPFAGENHIIKWLKESGIKCKSTSYDIKPKSADVSIYSSAGTIRLSIKKQDTLRKFP